MHTAIEVEHDTSTVRIDWHGYGIDQVETWADRVVEAAWQHGFRFVEFVHGAADVAARGTPSYEAEARQQRGSIKQLLRRRLYGGRWHRWALDRREGMHRIGESAMVIALSDNPDPDASAPWPLLPPPHHR